MWDFSILLSMRLLLRTLPFFILKAVVFLIFTVVLALGLLGGFIALKYLLDTETLPQSQTWLIIGAAVGLLAAIGIIRAMRSWALYLVKAAHIAVLVELAQGRPLPDGRGQISYGQSAVKDRFGEASALFLLDEVVKSALRAVDRSILDVLSFLPQKTGAQIATVLRLFLRFAFGCLDEIVLAHAINDRSDTPWASAHSALALYGQRWTTILKNAFWLTVFALVPVGLIFAFMVWPAWTEYQAAQAPETLKPLLIAALAMTAVGGVLSGPFALVCMLQVWFRAISDDRPSAAWSAEIRQIAPELNQFRGPRTNMARASGTTRNGDLV